MSAARDLIAALIASGMDQVDAMALAVRATTELAPPTDTRSAGAKRQAAWRERNKTSHSVTDETPDEASQNVSERNKTSQRDAASLSKKEISEDKKRKREASRAQPLPDGWRPDEPSWAESISVLGSVERAEYELKKFANHAAEKGRTAKNWNAAWRNWATRAVEYGGNRNGQSFGGNRTSGASGSPQSGSDAILAGVAAAAERRARERNAAGQHRDVPRNGGSSTGTDLELFGAQDGREPH